MDRSTFTAPSHVPDVQNQAKLCPSALKISAFLPGPPTEAGVWEAGPYLDLLVLVLGVCPDCMRAQ